MHADAFYKNLNKNMEINQNWSLLMADHGYHILPRMGIRHGIISGGVRSYIEHFNETLKDRNRMFDNYSPSTHAWVASHTQRWMSLFFILLQLDTKPYELQ